MKLLMLACVFLALPLQSFPQDPPKPVEEKPPVEAKNASEAAKRENPIKPTPDSLASGKKVYGMDCAMCHGKEGAGNGDLAADMHLKLRDYRDPGSLKSMNDGQIYWTILKGKGQMGGEEGRMSSEQVWDLVNYIRSLSRKDEAKN